MLCALSINKWNSLNKSKCPFVLYLRLILTVLWKSYVFTILKYLLFFPWGKFNCVLFIALGINTHSLLRNFLQGLLNTRCWERIPWCVEGGYIKVQPCTAGNKLGSPDNRRCLNSRIHGSHPDRSRLPKPEMGTQSCFFSGLCSAGSIWAAGGRTQDLNVGRAATPLWCSEGTVLEGGPGHCSFLEVGPHRGSIPHSS